MLKTYNSEKLSLSWVAVPFILYNLCGLFTVEHRGGLYKVAWGYFLGQPKCRSATDWDRFENRRKSRKRLGRFKWERTNICVWVIEKEEVWGGELGWPLKNLPLNTLTCLWLWPWGFKSGWSPSPRSSSSPHPILPKRQCLHLVAPKHRLNIVPPVTPTNVNLDHPQSPSYIKSLI